MKTRYSFIVLLFIFINNLNAQWINSINMSPANPNTTDTIYIYADCSFPSGGCEDHTQFATVNGTQIIADATHCLGMLTFICSTTDTFKLNPLPAGAYQFNLTVLYGSYPAPCPPVFNPGAKDSISFVVTNVNSIPVIDKDLFEFNLFPNPAKEQLHISCKNESLLDKNNLLVIYTLTGQELISIAINRKETNVDITSLSNGIYLCRIAGDGVNEKQLIEVKR